VHPNSKTQVVITNSSKKKKRTRKRKRITAQSAKATQADAFIYTEDQTTNQNDNNNFTGDVACAGDYQWLRHRFRQPQRCNKALASEKTWAAASYSEAEPD
jgi:hypothetical protein